MQFQMWRRMCSSADVGLVGYHYEETNDLLVINVSHMFLIETATHSNQLMLDYKIKFFHFSISNSIMLHLEENKVDMQEDVRSLRRPSSLSVLNRSIRIGALG